MTLHALSTRTGHKRSPDRATEQEEARGKGFFFLCARGCVCVRVLSCAALPAHSCGLMSGDCRVVRCEASSAQFGCGREHNERVTVGCLCVGECISAFCMRTYCIHTVRASRHVFKMHSISGSAILSW